MTQDLDIERTKAALLEQFDGFLELHGSEPRERFTKRMRALLDATPHDELLRLVRRVSDTGDDYSYFPPEPFARTVHRAMADAVLTPDSGLSGGERLAALGDASLILLPNHISYADANLIEILLHRAGLTSVAERMTVIAGPKVYANPMRRFLSLCFGTIKTAQSSSRSSGEAVMSAREVARIARKTIETSFERLDAGDVLLLFSEGTRSRDACMQRPLAAVARYLERPKTWLVPVGVTGTEHLIPVGEHQLHPTRVVVRIGEPIESDALVAQTGRKRQEMAETIGRAIAAALPPEYRGVYA